MLTKITVYTRTTCKYCEIVKKFLDLKSIAYSTVNMEEDDAAMQKVIALTGRSIAPTTVIDKEDGTQEVVVGVDFAKIAPAIA